MEGRENLVMEEVETKEETIDIRSKERQVERRRRAKANKMLYKDVEGEQTCSEAYRRKERK
jgi:hypothetical protein